MTLLAAARLCGEASPIAASVNYYPIASLEPALGAAWQHAQQLPEDPSSADWAAMSPLTHVAAGFPPTLLMHGSADTMVALDQSLRLHEALTQAGVPTDLTVFADQPHGFDLAAPLRVPLDRGRPLLPFAVRAAERRTRGSRGSAHGRPGAGALILWGCYHRTV